MNDNLAYKDDFVIKQRIELIDGRVFMMAPRPRYEHVTISTNIVTEFKIHLKGKKCQAFADGFDVFLDEKNRFIPDCMIVCNRDIIKRDGIHGAPTLVVEVISPSTAKNDRVKKKLAYERAGVQEYWLVSPLEKTIEVYLNSATGFYLDNIYYYLTDKEIAQNNALPDDDEHKLPNVYTEIKLSVCDFAVKIQDIFEHVDLN